MIRCILLALSISAVTGSIALAQAMPNSLSTAANQDDPDWQFQYSIFQMLLEQRGLSVGTTLDAAFANPQQSVLAIVGDLMSLPESRRTALSGFVRSGGSLLLASDSAFAGQSFGSLSVGPVEALREEPRYQGFTDCLQLAPNTDSQVLEGVGKIVTNRSGWFVPNPRFLQWETLVALPNRCVPRASQNKPVLCIGRDVSPIGRSASGLAVVSADASLFTNGMVWHGDNGIALIRLSEALCTPGKNRLAFVVDGQPLPSYVRQMPEQANNLPPNMPMPELPEPTLARALRLGNAVAKEVEASNILNEALKQRPSNLRPSKYFSYLLTTIAATFLVGTVLFILSNGIFRNKFLGLRRMKRGFEHRDSVAGSAGDYRSAAGFLAREFCFELTGSQRSADWQQFWSDIQHGNANRNASLAKFKKPLGAAQLQSLLDVIDVASRGYHTNLTGQSFRDFGRKIAQLRDLI